MLLAAAAFAGMSLLQSKGQHDQAKLDNIAKKSNDKVANIIRKAENQMAAAQASLQTYQQAQSNKYKLLTGGEAANAIATNLLRTADSLVAGGFERRIAAAEEAGTIAATAGAAGVGGGSLDMVSRASQLRVQRVEQQFAERQAQQLGDMELELDQTERATILGLDDIDFAASLNFMEQRTQRTPGVNWGMAGLQAGMAGMQAYIASGGSFGRRAQTTGLEQSVAGPGIQQSAAVSTSPFGARPQPTLRIK